MSIKLQRWILIIALATGTIVNVLCWISVIPVNYYNISLMIVSVISLLIVIISLFIPFLHKERSKYIKDLTKAEKVQAFIVAVLIVLWVITIIACETRFMKNTVV